MKYFVRSVKYFIYFSLLCALIICCLVLTGLAEGDINSLFRHGASDIIKIALLFLAIAAIYPKVGFITRSFKMEGSLQDNLDGVTDFMKERSYKLEKNGGNQLSFRRSGTMSRLTRMLEDRITLIEENGEIYVEGLRKDVVRIAMGLEYRFGPKNGPENGQGTGAEDGPDEQ